MNGDEIIIGPGTYTGVGDWVVNPMGKRLWIHSSDGAEVTIIDGEGMRHGISCRNYETSKTIFEGLTMTNCNGGIFNHSSSPMLTDCTFTDNGGGMYNWDSSPTLNGCTFTNNTSSGGIYGFNSYPTLTDTTVCGNTPDQIYGGWIDGGGNCIVYSCEDNDGDGIPDKCTHSGGNTILVPEDYASIQDAINVAVNGDEIIIGPGTYTGVGDWVVNPMGKRLWIHSSDGAEVTIIDGEGMRHGIQCAGGETSESIFEGLTMTNCNGGIFNSSSSPTLTDCTFENNTATNLGGGMYNIDSSSPTLNGCTFENNIANYGGGGMSNWDSSPTLNGCTFENNTANYGGGMRNNDSNPTLTNCTFTGNYSPLYYGGGMYNDSSSPALTDCIFDSNTANAAGGMLNYNNSSPTLENCMFTNNTASAGGGGMSNWDSSPTLTDCTFTNNTANSDGGGMDNNQSSPTLTDCTFENNNATNYGGGMYNYDDSDPTLNTCTFENNNADNGGGMYNDVSNTTLTNTIVCENTPDQIYGDWTDNDGNCVVESCNDTNDDGIPDLCPIDCPDINGDGYVNVSDLLTALRPVENCTNSPADSNTADGIVDVSDLLIVVGNWGRCE